MEPKVSFVCPAYQRMAWIAECIDSLQKQTIKDIEIIVIDDASTDYTDRIVKYMASKDPRIIYVKNEVNLGAGLSRNKGNEIAQADIICVTDSDDIYPDTRAEETLKYFEDNPKIDIVTSSYYRIDYSNGIVREFPAEKFDKRKFLNKEGSYFSHPSSAYRRKDILALPYKKESKEMTDDFMLVTDWCNADKNFGYTNKVWNFHRVLPGSIMTKMRGGSLE